MTSGRREDVGKSSTIAGPGGDSICRLPRGGRMPEDSTRCRTAFERDRDRILHSKAFRRLKHKTQVFMNPDGDHFVTRLTHTLQVTQIGRSMARYLGLNEPLTEAICLGHDVGHSPFGHTGEDALTAYVARRVAPLRPKRPDLRGPRAAQSDLGSARRDSCPLVEDRTAAGDAGGNDLSLRRPDRLPHPRRRGRGARRCHRPGDLPDGPSPSSGNRAAPGSPP